MVLSLDDLKSPTFEWSKFKGGVAILGYGLEGRATLSYLTKQGLNPSQITIYDAKEDLASEISGDYQFSGGENYMSKLNQNRNIQIIFRSPPVSLKLIKSSAIVWSGTNEFFARVKSKNLVGVTGTKGKGTTSSLIHQMLIEDGRVSHLLGNIGKPALSLISEIQPEDYVVLELSSFQLWDIKFSPQVAVILMITEDHLDIHDDIEDYRNAKFSITKFQNEEDSLIYFSENKISSKFGIGSPAGKKMPYPNKNFAHIINQDINFNDQIICSTTDVKLIGSHNLENVMASVNTAKALSLSSNSIAAAIKKFKGLPHRMEFVKTIDGLEIYNDSYSSNPSATLAAVKSFNKKIVLMLGGFDRGVQFGELAEVLKLGGERIKIFIYGENRLKIKDAFDKEGYSNYVVLGSSDSSNFEEIIKSVIADTKGEEVLIFSPGSASFDMFNNFEERGNQFKDIINKL
jgi:UDP-N-acetylmuramoylalanine--D-glutamate ligase